MKRLMNFLQFLCFSALAAFAVSCNLQEMNYQDVPDKLPSVMRFTASYPLVHTRATDQGFDDGDKMGVYVVDYIDGQAGTLETEGNRADNVRFTYNAASMSWTGTTDIYWKDKNTSVDIYGYYPFEPELSSVRDYRFTVSDRQDLPASAESLSGYEGSDLLWAKSEKVLPTSDVVTLTYAHAMAGITVILQEGSGFSSEEWASLEKTVLITNTVVDASVNLETGAVVPVDGAEVKIIRPYIHNDEYRAVVVPQMIAPGQELVSISVNGVSYSFARSDGMTYSANKMHKFTIRVDKREISGDYAFTVVGDSVSSWMDDPDFHDGVMRSYFMVKVESHGTLETVLRNSGADLSQLMNLKVVGPLSPKDFKFMREQLQMLTSLHAKEVILCDDNGVQNNRFPGNFNGKTEISHVVFPDKMEVISARAFEGTSLYGSLVIPEGVVRIEDNAFFDCPLTGRLILPSTLKYIGGGVFQYTDLSGEFRLPDGIEEIGSGAFDGCKFTGTYYLPSSLKWYDDLGFPGMTGDIIVPQGIKEINDGAHENSTCTSVTIPEGVEIIGSYAFRGSSIQGELKLPSTCRRLHSTAFKNTNISSVVLPEHLKFMGEGAFESCERLSGVVTLPQGVVTVPRCAFYGCTMLDGVVLHEDVLAIGEEAFRGCHNMSYFVCMAEEPPLVEGNAFYGVPRDNFVIEVPAGSVEKYKRAAGWKEFKRIAEYSNFVCRPATACALNSARRQTLVLNADGPWTVADLPEWCEVSPMSGNGKVQVTLTINQMVHGLSPRFGEVVFVLTDSGHQTSCKVSQYDYIHEEDQVLALQEATKGNGIDVFFVGDGWDAESISNGSYLSLVSEQMDHFFGIEPYTTYRDYFNVYAGIALSQETGINTLNTYRDTKFMTIYGGGGSKGVGGHLAIEEDDVFDYVTNCSSIREQDLWKTLVILVPNSTDYGGCTYLYDDGRAISICSPSVEQYPSDTRGIIQHEAGGHGFGKLADEIIIKNLFADAGTKSLINVYHGRGWYKNVATSGKMSDVPWAHFIFDPEYSDYVDIFEGAMGYTRGVWRSEQNSCMNYGIPYYNAISRQEIMRRILEYSGEGFTMEKFYATDSKDWGNTGNEAKSVPAQQYVQNAWHSEPCVEQ